jgi:hypothetical protein
VRAASQQLNLIAIFKRALIFNRAVIQAITTSPLLSALSSFFRAVSQLFTATPIPLRAIIFSRGVIGQFVLTDVVTRLSLLARALPQQLTLSLIAERGLAATRALSQTITSSAIAIRLGTFFRALTSSLTLVIEVVRGRLFERAAMIFLSISSALQWLKTVYVPPYVPPPYIPAIPIFIKPGIPTMEIEMPDQITLFLNETSYFTIKVDNTGDVPLTYLRAQIFQPPGLSINISPSLYPELEVNRSSYFLVEILSKELGIRYLTVTISTDQIRREAQIKVTTLERVIPINRTEVLEQLDELKSLTNYTAELLLRFLAAGYDVWDLVKKLNEVSRGIDEIERFIKEGRYERGPELLQANFAKIENIFQKVEERAGWKEMEYKRWIRTLSYIMLFLVAPLLVAYFIIKKKI